MRIVLSRTDCEVSQPPSSLFHVLVQPTDHDTRVFTRQVVRGLPHVQRYEPGTLPELEEERRDSVRDSEVVEVLGGTFRESLEEGRHF